MKLGSIPLSLLAVILLATLLAGYVVSLALVAPAPRPMLAPPPTVDHRKPISPD